MKKTLLALLLFCPFLVNGQGFQVNLQGQKQIAMGHAGTGLASDASSVFFNPGAVSMLEKNSVMVGFNPIFSKTAYRTTSPGTYTATTDNPMGTPFHLYGVWGPKDGKLKFGLGVYTPFGSGVKWAEDWRGRYSLQSIQLRSIFFQPTVSYKITDKISIGAGFVYSTGSVNLQQAVPLPFGGEGKAELDGKASGMGFNAGIFFKPSDKFSAGLTYRSGVKMKVDNGNATFNIPTTFSTVFPAAFPAQNKFTSTLPLPSVITAGIALTPGEKVTVAFDVNYTGWSTYDTLRFDYEKDRVSAAKEGVQLPDTKSPREYQNSFTFRGGVEYKVMEALSVRAGLYYGLSPVQAGYLTPETPDSNRTGYSFGLGYKMGNLNIDASFLYVRGAERTDTNIEKQFGGTYRTRGLIPGIGLSYSF